MGIGKWENGTQAMEKFVLATDETQMGRGREKAQKAQKRKLNHR
jgi:hypothetical protein